MNLLTVDRGDVLDDPLDEARVIDGLSGVKFLKAKGSSKADLVWIDLEIGLKVVHNEILADSLL